MNTNFNPQKIMRKIKIDFNCKDLYRKMQSARKYFNTGFSADFEFDLTRLNLIDASKVALQLSAELMHKNTKSKINCLLKDIETFEIIKPRKLKNTFLSVTLNENKVRDIYHKNIQIKTGSGT